MKISAMVLSAALIVSPVLDVQAKPDHTGLEVGQTSVMYDSSIGMPTSEANVIAQTTDGFIWIGSYSGLIRYDGSTFDRYAASTGIASVVSMFVDSKGQLWVGTNDSGVALVRGNDISMLSRAEGVPSSSVRSIAEDGAGNILFGTTQGMVYYDGETVHAYEDPRISTDYVCELRTDARGIVYGETYDGNFFSVDGTEVKDYFVDDELDIGAVSCITVDDKREGWVYLGTEGKAIIHADMDGGMKDYEIIETPEQEHIKTIELVGDEIWIGADDGIAHIDSDGNYMKLSQVDMNNSVDKMMVDYEGNLWFASSRQGIMKITDSVFANITRVAGVYDRVCNTTILYNGDLYIGTDTGLVVLDEHRQVKQTPVSDLLSEARVRCIKSDSKGNLWVSTFSEHGLVRLGADGSIREYTSESGLPSNRVRTTCERANGDIVVSASGGITVLRDGEPFKSFGVEDGLLNTELLTLEEDSDGNFYMGSDGDGLYIVDRDENMTAIRSSDGLRSDVILRAKWDEGRKVLWLITSNSVAYYKDGEVTTISDFPYANNFDIFFDENNNVWVLGSGGIYVVNADMMLENKKIDYVLYDATSGLAHVTTANSHNYVSEDGDLYVAGTTGVSMVNINEAHATSTNIRLTVPFIEADDEQIYLDESGVVTLPSSIRRIKIHGYALSYSLNNPRIEYCLKGFDKKPTVTTKRDMDEAVYTNLDGGT
ncbi:MAG: histidine kinase, partial [Lachnospiraceae bacterium]|nr:histidine kinase [Lachnospiraceae bacterium]